MEGLAGVAIATSPATMAYKDVPMSIKVDVSQEIDRPVADVFPCLLSSMFTTILVGIR
jgi:hypothetical protein